jgi:hypothetical protein
MAGKRVRVTLNLSQAQGLEKLASRKTLTGLDANAAARGLEQLQRAIAKTIAERTAE